MKRLGILLFFVANCAVAQRVTGNHNSGSVTTPTYAHTVGEIYVVPASQSGAAGGTVAVATQIAFGSLGTGDFVTLQGVNYFPNPVQDYLTVSLPQAYDLGKAEVYDANGKKVPCTFAENKLDMAALTPGVYFINFPGSSLKSIKIVKR